MFGPLYWVIQNLASQHIFGYAPSRCALSDPPPQASWVLQWMLMHHSPKHRFQSKKLPNLDWVASDSWNAMQRYLWRLHCNTQGTSPASSLPQSPLPYLLASPWLVLSHFVGWSISAACYWTLPELMSVVSLARLTFMAFCAYIGRIELQKTDLIPVPLDKEPRFVLVSPSDFSIMEELALPDKYYRPWPLENQNVQTTLTEYAELAGDIGRYHCDHRVASNIRSSVTHGSFVCALGISVKSHKDLGEQGLRTIHKGFNPSFAGLSHWLVKVLDPYARAIQWSYKDSFAVRETLLSIPTNPDTIIANIDLKDFSYLVSHIILVHAFQTLYKMIMNSSSLFSVQFSCCLIISL